MRTEKEIRDKLFRIKYKVWRNGADSYIWEKVQDILEWVLNDKQEQKIEIK